MSQHDDLYRSAMERVPPFSFNDKVAAVFPDMIQRSVPGYAQVLSLLPSLVGYILPTLAANAPRRIYDLGCSHGAGLLAAAQGLAALGDSQSYELIGVDNSQAMIAHARQNEGHFERQHQVAFLEHDILKLDLQPNCLVLMHYTLQFLPIDQRAMMIERIAHSLCPGGVFILSEKLAFSNNEVQTMLTGIHHQFKQNQGYSELEVSQKRDAIEKVLVSESLATHIERLQQAGFRWVTPWVQNLQFVSLLAVK